MLYDAHTGTDKKSMQALKNCSRNIKKNFMVN